MNQPQKLQVLLKELRAYEVQMEQDGRVGVGCLYILGLIIIVRILIEGDIFLPIVLGSCLCLGILSYYWISAFRARRSWYWEEVRRGTEGKGLREMWATCERGDWLLWFSAHMIGKDKWPTHQQIVLAACQCARLALKHVKSGETTPIKAIETTEAWARGEATLEQVRIAGEAANYSEHDDRAYWAAQAAHDAAWAVYVHEDGHSFRLAQAASGAATSAARAARQEVFAAQFQIHDFTPTAHGARDHAEKTTLRECADIVRRMLSVPDALTNELPIYEWAYRRVTGRMRKWDSLWLLLEQSGLLWELRSPRWQHIPIAVSRQSTDLRGDEIESKKVNPVLRVATVILVLAAAGFLIGALDKHSSYYYTILRWLTCAAAVMLIWRGAVQGSLKWAYVLLPVVVLFNPIIQIHLNGKRPDVLNTWQTMDIVVAVVMVLAMILIEMPCLLTKKTRLRAMLAALGSGPRQNLFDENGANHPPTMTMSEAEHILEIVSEALLDTSHRGGLPVSALQGYDILQIDTANKLQIANMYLHCASRHTVEESFAAASIVGALMLQCVPDDQADDIGAELVWGLNPDYTFKDKRFGSLETESSFADYCKSVGLKDPLYWQKIYTRIGLEYTAKSPRGNSPVFREPA